MLSPKVCLNQTRPRFQELPFLDVFLNDKDLGKVENQWNYLLSVDWSVLTKDGVRKVPENSYEFWPRVYEYKNAGGVQVFRELATFALTILSLATSNAVVERAFSIMNAVKIKSRNRIQTPLLDSLLRIRLHFYEYKICCVNFQPTQAMLRRFNYKDMYPKNGDNNNHDNHDDANIVEAELEIFEIFDEMNDFNVPCICIPE